MARREIDVEFDYTPNGAAYTPDDEDYMDPSERAEAMRLFRPGRLVGAQDAEALARSFKPGPKTLIGYRRLRLVGDDESLGLTNGQVAFLVVIAVTAGGLVGWWWRKRREKKTEPQHKTLIGLDLLGVDWRRRSQ